jgi:hypothetical protein
VKIKSRIGRSLYRSTASKQTATSKTSSVLTDRHDGRRIAKMKQEPALQKDVLRKQIVTAFLAWAVKGDFSWKPFMFKRMAGDKRWEWFQDRNPNQLDIMFPAFLLFTKKEGGSTRWHHEPLKLQEVYKIQEIFVDEYRVRIR